MFRLPRRGHSRFSGVSFGPKAGFATAYRAGLRASEVVASARRTALTVTLPLAMPGMTASAIFVFLERSTSLPAPISWGPRT